MNEKQDKCAERGKKETGRVAERESGGSTQITFHSILLGPTSCVPVPLPLALPLSVCLSLYFFACNEC